MGQESILRRIALVSYGTRFLRGEIALDAFAGHGLFDGTRSQFRDEAKHVVSKDFTRCARTAWKKGSAQA